MLLCWSYGYVVCKIQQNNMKHGGWAEHSSMLLVILEEDLEGLSAEDTAGVKSVLSAGSGIDRKARSSATLGEEEEEGESQGYNLD